MITIIAPVGRPGRGVYKTSSPGRLPGSTTLGGRGSRPYVSRSPKSRRSRHGGGGQAPSSARDSNG